MIINKKVRDLPRFTDSRMDTFSKETTSDKVEPVYCQFIVRNDGEL